MAKSHNCSSHNQVEELESAVEALTSTVEVLNLISGLVLCTEDEQCQPSVNSTLPIACCGTLAGFSVVGATCFPTSLCPVIIP